MSRRRRATGPTQWTTPADCPVSGSWIASEQRWATAEEVQTFCAAKMRFFDSLPPKLREHYRNPKSVPLPEES